MITNIIGKNQYFRKTFICLYLPGLHQIILQSVYEYLKLILMKKNDYHDSDDKNSAATSFDIFLFACFICILGILKPCQGNTRHRCLLWAGLVSGTTIEQEKRLPIVSRTQSQIKAYSQLHCCKRAKPLFKKLRLLFKNKMHQRSLRMNQS